VPKPAPRQRRGTILFSLLVLLFFVGVVPLVFTSYTLVRRGRDILELHQKELQLDKARSLSQQVAVYVQSLRSHVTAVARTLEVEGGSEPFSRRVARIRDAKALERYVGEGSRFYSFNIGDVHGSGARSGAQIPEPAIEQMLQEGYYRGLEGKPMMGPPIFSTALQEPVIVLSEPVASTRGAEGVVLAVASLGPLWNMTQQMGTEGRVEVYIVDSRGKLVAHSEPARLQEDLDYSQVEIVRQFLDAKGRTAATVPFEIAGPKGRVRMLGTYTGVPDASGWGVIVQVDAAKAYHEATRMSRQSMALVGAVTVLAAVFGFLFAGQISSPIQELAAFAGRLAGGEYGARVRVRSANEVGVLADAFNAMGGEIQRAIHEIRRQADINKELFMGTVRMLANAIDEKDPYTRGHSERVAYYSAVLAKHLGMSPEEVERVHLSGIIHDVGKIGIEDKILRKPAALTDEEYEIMKQHPTKGLKILDAVPRLKDMAGAGLMHHENVDGSGYPDGLKGDAIPLLGRIVSVADAFDAMTTDRPYAKAMTFEAALARLRLLANKKFDERCVGAMERAFAAGDLTMAKARKASLAARQAAAVAS
jgi:HD-GYP domain-containing protein (c-di-GMP phosphodiesterase class II)